MATPTPKQGVVCVGSLNVDIFAYMERFPNPGLSVYTSIQRKGLPMCKTPTCMATLT